MAYRFKPKAWPGVFTNQWEGKFQHDHSLGSCCEHFNYRSKQSLLPLVTSSDVQNQLRWGVYSPSSPSLSALSPCTKASQWGVSFTFPLLRPHKGDPFQLLLAPPLSTYSSLCSLPLRVQLVEGGKQRHQVDVWRGYTLLVNESSSSQSHQCWLSLWVILSEQTKTDMGPWSIHTGLELFRRKIK